MARSVALLSYVSAALVVANAAARLGGSARRERGHRSLTDDSFIEHVKVSGEVIAGAGSMHFFVLLDRRER